MTRISSPADAGKSILAAEPKLLISSLPIATIEVSGKRRKTSMRPSSVEPSGRARRMKTRPGASVVKL